MDMDGFDKQTEKEDEEEGDEDEEDEENEGGVLRGDWGVGSCWRKRGWVWDVG